MRSQDAFVKGEGLSALMIRFPRISAFVLAGLLCATAAGAAQTRQLRPVGQRLARRQWFEKHVNGRTYVWEKVPG